MCYYRHAYYAHTTLHCYVCVHTLLCRNNAIKQQRNDRNHNTHRSWFYMLSFRSLSPRLRWTSVRPRRLSCSRSWVLRIASNNSTVCCVISVGRALLRSNLIRRQLWGKCFAGLPSLKRSRHFQFRISHWTSSSFHHWFLRRLNPMSAVVCSSIILCVYTHQRSIKC